MSKYISKYNCVNNNETMQCLCGVGFLTSNSQVKQDLISSIMNFVGVANLVPLTRDSSSTPCPELCLFSVGYLCSPYYHCINFVSTILSHFIRSFCRSGKVRNQNCDFFQFVIPAIRYYHCINFISTM